MANIHVLGGGAVGSLIADSLLTQGNRVRLLDASKEILASNRDRNPGLKTAIFDGTEREAFVPALKDCDLAINALPGWLGHQSLKLIIESGVDCVDIAFTPEDPRSLDPLARDRGATVVVDAGVAPGLSNLLAARLLTDPGVDSIGRLDIYVGGLPVRRTPPWEYAAPFSISDIIEEYTRPARIKKAGKVVQVPALTGRRPLEVEGVGTLEAFLTDGLRTLLDLPVADMAEYTLRYPGHAAKAELLRDAGFFSTMPIKSGNEKIRPLDLTLELLKEQWRLHPGEPEFTHLRVTATDKEGQSRGWVLHDVGQEGWSSMARTTGLTAVAFAELILEGVIDTPGVHPPETFGNEYRLVEEILGKLARSNVFLTEL